MSPSTYSVICYEKICPLFGQILITCLKCSRASFLPSSYSEKMRWGRGWVTGVCTYILQVFEKQWNKYFKNIFILKKDGQREPSTIFDTPLYLNSPFWHSPIWSFAHPQVSWVANYDIWIHGNLHGIQRYSPRKSLGFLTFRRSKIAISILILEYYR